MSELKMYLWSICINDSNYTGVKDYIVVACTVMEANLIAYNLHFDTYGNPSIGKMTTSRLTSKGIQVFRIV